MVEQSAVIENLGKALSLAQSQMLGAKKDAINPHFRSKYADLESVWQGCRDALTNNGLSVVQMPGFEDGMCVLYTQLIHSSGEWIRSRSAAPILKQDAQAVGSALTYLRRYALAAVVGVCPEDDDGNGCSDTRQPERKGPPKQARKPAPPDPEEEYDKGQAYGEEPESLREELQKPDPALSLLDEPKATPVPPHVSKPKPLSRWECHPRLLAACKEAAKRIGGKDRARVAAAGTAVGDAIENLYGPLPDIAEGDALEGAIEIAVDFTL